tara:strand:+ start:2426 stop:3196 length:771 start_codon:yes stop_codon:yes gene_type:complete
MKLKLYTFFLITFNYYFLKAQELEVNIGYYSVEQSSGSYIFSIIDDSPSRDQLTTSFTLSEIDPNIHMGLSVISNDNEKHNFSFGFGLNLGVGGNYTLGVGYHLNLLRTYHEASIDKKPKFSWNLSILAGGGMSWRNLGTLNNNALYIQFNNVKFDDRTDVELWLRGGFGYLIPRMEWAFYDDPATIKSRKGWKIWIGYGLSTGTNKEISLQGQLNGEKHREKLSISRGSLTKNNEPVNSLYIRPAGIVFGITLLY